MRDTSWSSSSRAQTQTQTQTQTHRHTQTQAQTHRRTAVPRGQRKETKMKQPPLRGKFTKDVQQLFLFFFFFFFFFCFGVNTVHFFHAQ